MSYLNYHMYFYLSVCFQFGRIGVIEALFYSSIFLIFIWVSLGFVHPCCSAVRICRFQDLSPS